MPLNDDQLVIQFEYPRYTLVLRVAKTATLSDAHENYSQTDDLRTAATEISGVVWRMEIRVVLLKKSVAESRTEAELFAHRRRLVSVL